MAVLGGCAMAPQQASTQAPLAHMQVPLPSVNNDVTAQIMRAEFALAHGDMPAAASAYEQAASVSSDPDVAERAADLALTQGDMAAAQKALQRMRTLAAKDTALAYVEARMALSQGHRAPAKAALLRVLAPGDRDAWSAFAQLLAGARDPAAAGLMLEALATPKTLPAKDASVWVAVSQLGEKLRRHTYAQRIATAAVQHFGNAQTYTWAAQLAQENGDEAAVKTLLTKAIKAAPKDIRLRLVYASVLGKQGHNREAQQLLADGPQNIDVYAARAAYAARDNDTASLNKIYAQLRDAKPSEREQGMYLLGQLADTLGKHKAALAWYAKVPADSEHSFDANVRRAVLLNDAGKTEQAHALARRLATDNAEDDDLLRHAVQLDAQLYRLEHDHAGAIAAFDRGLKSLPDDAELLYGRSLSEADSGQAAAAIKDLRHVLKIDPDNIEAVNALGYTLADSHQHLDEATKLLTQALAAKPDEPAVIDSWGWLQYRLGHLAEAEKALQSAWGKLKDADIGVHLGEVLWVQNKRKQAQAVFEQVRKIDPENAALKATLKRLHP
ncbi:MAG: tetratricopeptide repeat protein [Xanthomonadales bacterium]|nr:tetratricopeptide repeat protein [Xanthomonadales bacterium]